MTTDVKLGTLAIGAAGELLVQYRLLKLGIDSAQLTTDSGIDLAMYLPGNQVAATIQVKAKNKPVPAGGKGKPSLNWPVPPNCPAHWLACVDLSRDKVWLFEINEAYSLAKQDPPLMYWFIDEAPKDARREVDMDSYLLETVIENIASGSPRHLR